MSIYITLSAHVLIRIFSTLFQVTTFGGEKVLNLLQAIERHHKKFRSPPIGPVGAHVVRRSKLHTHTHTYYVRSYVQ